LGWVLLGTVALVPLVVLMGLLYLPFEIGLYVNHQPAVTAEPPDTFLYATGHGVEQSLEHAHEAAKRHRDGAAAQGVGDHKEGFMGLAKDREQARCWQRRSRRASYR
jgi:hypothetical protein